MHECESAAPLTNRYCNACWIFSWSLAIQPCQLDIPLLGQEHDGMRGEIIHVFWAIATDNAFFKQRPSCLCGWLYSQRSLIILASTNRSADGPVHTPEVGSTTLIPHTQPVQKHNACPARHVTPHTLHVLHCTWSGPLPPPLERH